MTDVHTCYCRCDEVKRLGERIARYGQDMGKSWLTLSDRLKVAEEALSFYDEWHQGVIDLRDALNSEETPLAPIGENIARTALAKIRGGEK